MTNSINAWPELPYEDWVETKDLLHLMLQIVGKIRLALHAGRNHWWHAPFYVTARGLTTRTLWSGDHAFQIDFDLREHALEIVTSDGRHERLSLTDTTIARFYADLFARLAALGIAAPIKDLPYEHPSSRTPFSEDTQARPYQSDAVERYWRVLLQLDRVFQEFRGRFLGKSTPVHVFWHSMDLALTRFSGRPAPAMEGGTRADQEAYSHEVISFGFWAGDPTVREAAFYAYAYPEPPGLSETALQPDAARWNTEGGTTAFLRYEDLRNAGDPAAALSSFLQGSYEAMAGAAGWDIEALTWRPKAPPHGAGPNR